MAKKEVKAMTKAQLMAHLSEKTGIAKKDVVALWEELTALAYKEAKKEKGFTLPGLGKIIVVKRKARTARNPQTGEPIRVPARKALKFRIAKQAKDAIVGVKK
ncbi:MAG: DNA-binding protein HU-beta [Candidatus Sumerlaeota bacterium]|nr:DNA-binding protein HU-beta [Candidatus Sumerlaeota bacterium]